MKLKLLEDVPFYRKVNGKVDPSYDVSYFLPKGTVLPVEETEEPSVKEILDLTEQITIK